MAIIMTLKIKGYNKYSFIISQTYNWKIQELKLYYSLESSSQLHAVKNHLTYLTIQSVSMFF